MINQLNIHELTGLKNALGQFDVRRGGLSFTKWMIMCNHALYTTNFIGPLSYQAFSFLKLLALS